MGLFNKKELVEISRLKQENKKLSDKLTELDGLSLIQIQDEISIQKQTLAKVVENIENAKNELNEIQGQIASKKTEIIELDEAITLQEFGVYSPIYEFANSEQYKDQLTLIRGAQKTLIKNNEAAKYPEDFTFNGSLAKGKTLVKDNVKQILRSFNNECDVLINSVKFNTIDNSRKKIEKSFEQLNKMNSRMTISLTSEYLKLKLEELNLAYEYSVKKQEEKEAQKEERARLREEAKLQKELEEARKNIDKERKHYSNALDKLLKKIEENPEDTELINKKVEIETHLATIEEESKEIDYREANKRAGYVYIISNIGSFGEDVYKIGMTRRLEPLDRVNELGDASVPFNFDLHALIFSDDAPQLENALHKAFEKNKVNMINSRREFFNVKLDEIEAVVKANYDKTIDFKKTPEAEQYRETLAIKKVIN